MLSSSQCIAYTYLCPILPLLKPYTTNQTSVAICCRYTPPPYANASVNIRPLPIFFIFFWIFTLLQYCIFSYTQLNLLCKIILFIIISIFMFCVDAFLFRFLLFPFVYLNNQREWGVRCAHSFFMFLSFYVFWIRHFSFIYIGYV